jgi:hypothetical protein
MSVALYRAAGRWLAIVSIQGSWAERVMLSVGTMSMETTVEA